MDLLTLKKAGSVDDKQTELIYDSSVEMVVFSVLGDDIEDQYEIDVGEGGIITSVGGKSAQLTMSSMQLPLVGGIISAGGKSAHSTISSMWLLTVGTWGTECVVT